MRLRISHETVFTYEPPASGTIQTLRVTPANHDSQYVADWRIDLSCDSTLRMGHDAFGNITHTFHNDGPIERLAIHVDGLVETQDTGGIVRGTVERFPPSLFLRSTALTHPSAEMRDLAQSHWTRAGGKELDFLHRLMSDVSERLAVEESHVASAATASAVFETGRGAASDFTHVFLACARSVGVPVRFVSGYALQDDVDVQSGHAWAEAFVPALGWVGFDIASGICVTDAYIRVAIGLDALGAASLRHAQTGNVSEIRDVVIDVMQVGRQSQS